MPLITQFKVRDTKADTVADLEARMEDDLEPTLDDISKAGHGRCSWPYAGMTACGRAVDGRKPYCVDHARKAYRKPIDSPQRYYRSLRKFFA